MTGGTRAGASIAGARKVIPFTKVEGLGNDFVVVDLRPGRAAAESLAQIADPAMVAAICDRHFGVGADGVLAILPAREGDARMRVLNADGSEAEMCGNGLRCVAKVLYESDPNLRRSPLWIDTGAGVLECTLDVSDTGAVSAVGVQMGRPLLTREEIPLLPGGPQPATRETIMVRGQSQPFHFTGVSMGNPHAVIFIDDTTADLRALAEAYGPVIETAATFPRKTNVEFARVRAGGNDIDLVVWERGCGITLACGTGACAVAVAAGIEGRCAWGTDVTVHLPGGALFIKVAADGSGVRMRGPARNVFQSELDLSSFRSVAGVQG